MAAAKAGPMPWLKPAVLTGALIPLVDLIVSAARGTLGPNAIDTALNRLGLLALVMLLLSLVPTPLKILFNWTWPVRIRRYTGNLAFTYVLLHFLIYAVLDQSLALGPIFADIAKRPFILIGFTAFVMLIPLAVTSTDAAVRRMGFVKWKRLHRLAYFATAFGVIHYYMRVKADVTQPVVYGVVLALLLAIRVFDAVRSSRAKKAKAAKAAAVRSSPTA